MDVTEIFCNYIHIALYGRNCNLTAVYLGQHVVLKRE